MTPLRGDSAAGVSRPGRREFLGSLHCAHVYLSPLLIALVFGVPYSDALARLDTGELTQRVLSSALFGAFAALGGIGLRMATLRTLPRA